MTMMGTPLVDTTLEAQRGSQDGYYIRSEDGQATILTFATVHERQRLVLQSRVQAKPGETVQVLITVDRETGRPNVQAISCVTGRPVKVGSIGAGEPGTVPLLEQGQVVRFTNNQNRGHGVSGIGCVERIVRIQDGVSPAMAVGDMRDYQLVMHHPDGIMPQVRSETRDLEILEVGLPRPGQMIQLERLSNQKFTRLEPVVLHQFTRVGRPGEFRVEPAKADRAKHVLPKEQLRSAVPEQPPVAEAMVARKRQTIGSRLLGLLGMGEKQESPTRPPRDGEPPDRGAR